MDKQGLTRPETASQRPETRIDLSDPDIWLAGVPDDEFARLRQDSPIAWNERTDGQAGFWAVTRHDDIVAVSRDTEVFSSRNGVISLDDFDDEQNDSRRTLLEMDPPQHTAMRKVTSPKFTPRSIRAFEDFSRAVAARLIDEAVGAGPIDIVTSVAKQLPILTLCKVMGIEEDRRADMIRWSDALIGSDDPEYVDPAVAAVPEAERRLLPFGHPASLEAFDLGRELAEQRRRVTVNDVVGALALGHAAGQPLTDQEFCNYFVMLVVAGNETTRHTLSHGIAALADNPEQWDRFRGSRGSSEEVDGNVAADEILRWASAVHFVRRIATKDVEIGGAKIAAGDKVAMYYASGNRDVEHFEDPMRFIIDRSPNNHVAFGRGGPHFCIGAHVARMQVRVFLEELAKRVSGIESHAAPERLRSNHINGIKRHMISLV